MMAKITKGASFGGAVRYVLDPKKGIGTIAADGVRVKNIDSVIRSFETQAGLNPRLSKPVGHISLDFSAQDSSKLDNLKMVAIALEYMQRMAFTTRNLLSVATMTVNIRIYTYYSIV